MEKVKLYIGSSMGELNKKAVYTFEQGRSTRIHINHSDKTFQAAEEARLKGDEERGYILYMRYLDIFQKVRSSREYKKDESHYSLLLGTSKFKEAIDKAEKLSTSLKNRYEDLKSASNEHTAGKDDVKETNGVLTPKSDNLPKTVDEEKAVPPMVEPVSSEPELVPDESKTITAQKLYEILFSQTNSDKKVLILDIRTPEEYQSSRIRHQKCINVPKTSIKPGAVCKKIEGGIQDIDHLNEWKSRATADVIVLVDWDGGEKRLADLKDPLRSLKDALWKWDQEIFLKREPVVLSGGFLDWLDYFPQFSTDPKVQRPNSKPKAAPGVNSLINFSFHDLINHDSGKRDGTNDNDEKDLEEEENWKNAEVLDNKAKPVNHSPILNGSNGQSTNGSFMDHSSSLNLYPEVPRNVNLASDKKEREPDEIPVSVLTKKTSNGNVVYGAFSKKNTPSVDRTTKPQVPNRDLKPQTSKEDVSSRDGEPVAAPNMMNWPPVSFIDSADNLAPTPAPNVEDPEVAAVRSRIEAAKRRKEENEQKRKEIEDKKRLAELHAIEKQLEKEAEEEERQRKIAEKDLADRMRELSKPIKPKESHKLTDVLDSKTPSSKISNIKIQDSNDGRHVLQSGSVEPIAKKKDETTVPLVPRQSKPTTAEAAQDKDKLQNESVTNDTSAEPIYAKVTKPKSQPTATVAPVANLTSVEPIVSNTVTVPISTKTIQNEPETVKKTVTKSASNVSIAEKQAPVATKKPDAKPPGKASTTEKLEPAPKRSPQPEKSSVPKGNQSSPYAHKTLIKTNDTKANAKLQPDPIKQAQKPKETPPTQLSSGKKQRRGSTNLPLNWEKRLDSKTGRYFYLDHSTKTTHWMLPNDVISTQIKKAPLKDDTASSSGSLKRSHSTPNIAQLIENEELEKTKPRPVPNRNNKPSLVPEAIPDLPEVYTQRLLRLHPVYGGSGPGICGLQNLGNTCYMNSVLQCMFNTTLLAEYFLNNLYKRDINRTNFLGSGGEITDGFATVLKAVWEGKYRHLTPRDFRFTIAKFNPRFGGYIQQDSQELLLFLMDGLHEDLNRITKRTYIEEDDNDHLDDQTAADVAWRHHKRLNESIIVELFQGQFKATVQCLHCKKTSRKFDVFMYLSLPLPSSQSCSIHDCIENFSKVEKLSGENQWRCPACKTERDAVRKMEIWKLPPVLLIHFKRFSFCGRWRDKIQTSVSFPSTGLNMNKYVKGPDTRKAYSLYSVSHHHGASLDSGHYVASCKSPLDNNWYKFDDHEVSRTTVPQGPSAYILCYTSLGHSLSISVK